MKFLKRLPLLALLFAFLIGFFTFSALAAPVDNQITIVYGDYTRTYDITGCNTWRDLVAKDTPMVNFLSIDRSGRVVYNYTDNYVDYETFVVCDENFLTVYADDVFEDTVYTFGILRLMFDGESIYSLPFDSGTFWFDFVGDSLDPGIFSDDYGFLFYRDEIGVVYQIYDEFGNEVDENDEILSNHYYLVAQINFRVDFSDVPGSVTDTVIFSGSFASFNLDKICDDNVVVLDDLNEYYFEFSPYGQAVLVDDFTGEEYYLIYDGAFISEAVTYCIATQNPCAFGLHPGLIVTAYTSATCTVDGLKTSKCRLCGEYSEEVIPAGGHHYYKEVVVEPTCEAEGLKGRACSGCDRIAFREELPALGHDLNILGNCKRCDYSKAADAWNDFLEDIPSGSGGVGGSDELPPWVQSIMDFFGGNSETNTDWFSELNASIDKFLNTVKVIGILIVGIIVLPYLLKGVAWVWKRLAEAFEDIGGFFKNISKSARKKAARSGK